MTLTLPAGTIIKGTSTGDIYVEGTLDVNGTSSNWVVFTSDSGYFQNSVSEYSAQHGMRVYRSSPTITNSTFTDNADYGLYVYDHPSAAPIIQCSLITQNTHGVYCSGGAAPTIMNHNNIYGNTTYGVYNDSSSVTINAEDNWWGNPSGPGGVGPGSGDSVSYYVDYDPWLAASSPCAPGEGSPPSAGGSIPGMTGWGTMALVMALGALAMIMLRRRGILRIENPPPPLAGGG